MNELLVVLALSILSVLPAATGMKTDWQKDSLIGSVRVVRIEAARFSNQPGPRVEEPRELVAVITYDTGGRKIEVVSGPIGTGVIWYFENIPHDKRIILTTLSGI